MKPNTHGMPNGRHIRRKTVRDKLMAAGWFTNGNVIWKHPKLPDRTLTRADAVKLQAAWETAKPEVA